MPVFNELDLEAATSDWGLERFLDATEEGRRSLVVRNAFDPAKARAETIAPLDSQITYTTRPIDFKTGHDYRRASLREYLSLIEKPGEYYSSWGRSSMNDKSDAVREFTSGAQGFVDICLHDNWSYLSDQILSSAPESRDWNLRGHFIAGNTQKFDTKTENHYVLTLNHVFQIAGEKTWYLSDPVKAMEQKEFFQFNAMEFKLGVSREEYANLPFVETLVTRPGDYFYNAPMTGHAVAMGPGKNVMLSLRKHTLDIVLAPELNPLLQRSVNVTREIIHSDVNTFRRWCALMPVHDKALYLDGPPVPPEHGQPGIKESARQLLSAVRRRLQRG